MEGGRSGELASASESQGTRTRMGIGLSRDCRVYVNWPVVDVSHRERYVASRRAFRLISDFESGPILIWMSEPPRRLSVATWMGAMDAPEFTFSYSNFCSSFKGERTKLMRMSP